MNVEPGDTVELVFTDDEYTELKPGARGKVTHVGEWIEWDRRPFRQVSISWDNGSRLMLCEPHDRFRIIEKAASSHG